MVILKMQNVNYVGSYSEVTFTGLDRNEEDPFTMIIRALSTGGGVLGTITRRVRLGK